MTVEDQGVESLESWLFAGCLRGIPHPSKKVLKSICIYIYILQDVTLLSSFYVAIGRLTPSVKGFICILYSFCDGFLSIPRIQLKHMTKQSCKKNKYGVLTLFMWWSFLKAIYIHFSPGQHFWFVSIGVDTIIITPWCNKVLLKPFLQLTKHMEAICWNEFVWETFKAIY